jgi:DNA-binding NtrC family response regulator
MPGAEKAGDAPGFDDRCPYAVVEAVFATIAKLDPSCPGSDAAWEAFVSSRGAEDRNYFEAIRSSHHSIFLHQQQELYEFGIEKTSEPAERFCAACGRQFMKAVSLDNVYGFVRRVLSSPRSFQATIAEVARAHVERYAPGRYRVTHEKRPRALSLTIETASPDEAAAYFAAHGLDPERCFSNSFHFIAGALNAVLSQVVRGYDASGAEFSVSGQTGTMRFPLGGGDRFSYRKLLEQAMAYVERTAADREAEAEDERREKDLVLGSDVMRRTWEKIRRASRSDEIVLLRGESGTGKSFIARKIHELSRRSGMPFVEVGLTSDVGSDNMVPSDLFGHERGAFTGAAEQKQGLFSLADGGTIFLDEVGDASRELQAKLLRVVETSTFKRLGGTKDLKVDVRVIAATNRDLEAMVADGAFRQDLYYRLNVIPVELPPLRERSEDVPALAGLLLARAGAKGAGARKRLPDDLASALSRHPWPGNVRELDHALRHAAAMCEGEELSLADFPESVRASVGGCAKAVAPGGKAAPSRDRPPDSDVINVEALRRMIRSADPVSVAAERAAHGVPAHIEHAKRAYLAALIDELGGDLSLVAKFWDRTSEKTILKLVREYGLERDLEAARLSAGRRGRSDEVVH